MYVVLLTIIAVITHRYPPLIHPLFTLVHPLSTTVATASATAIAVVDVVVAIWRVVVVGNDCAVAVVSPPLLPSPLLPAPTVAVEVEDEPCYDDDVEEVVKAPVNPRPPIVIKKTGGSGTPGGAAPAASTTPKRVQAVTGTSVRVNGFVRPVVISEIKVDERILSWLCVV